MCPKIKDLQSLAAREINARVAGSKHRLRAGSVSAQALLAIVERRGLELQQVAQELDVTPSHLSRVLSGSRGLSLELAIRIQDFYGVDVRGWLSKI